MAEERLRQDMGGKYVPVIIGILALCCGIAVLVVLASSVLPSM